MNSQMKAAAKIRQIAGTALIVFLISYSTAAQVSAVDSVVPRLVNYVGLAKDTNGKPLKGAVGATFAVYAAEEGGAPLWIETQNIAVNANGSYTVMLGATKSAGLPVDLFSTGQARWLAVSFNGGAEQPRVALLSVPYALKAGDAQTLGGLPVSAFMLAAPVTTSIATAANTNSSEPVAPPAGTITGAGTAGFLPDFTGTATIGNSAVFQSGASPAAKIGINTNAPTTALDVHGGAAIRGTLVLPALGVATATVGKTSQPENLSASAFNSASSTPVTQTFQLKAEPTSNNTASASASLNFLFGQGTTAPAETGLKISSNGQLTFAAGQTFPGTGTISGVSTASGSGLTGGGTSGTLNLKLLSTCTANQILKWSGSAWACATDNNSGGSVTSVALAAPSSDFTVSGSPLTTKGTLNLAWTVAPTSVDTANAIVKRDASGNFSAGAITSNSLNTNFINVSRPSDTRSSALRINLLRASLSLETAST
jgi:hypothetical protein